jgi:hypothetical protein
MSVKLNEIKSKALLLDPKFKNQWVEVIQVNINDGNAGRVAEWEGGYAYGVDLRTLKPIQLTKELVEKLLPLNGVFPDNDDFYIEQSGHNPVYFDLCYGKTYTGVSIQWLHQLQGLYFYVTMSELETKNKV